MNDAPVDFEKSRSGLLFTYLQIVFNQLSRWTALQEVNEADRPKSFPRTFTWNQERQSEIRETHVLAILSSALFLEAFIYDYLARNRSGGFAQKLDKLEPANKWLIGTQLSCPPGMSSVSEEYSRLSALFKHRNQLVHHKSKENGTVFEAPELPADFLPWDCMNTVGRVLKLLTKLDEQEDVAPMLLRHIGAWFEVAKRDINFYPIPTNA